MRRQFHLPPEDVQFLEEYGLPWEAVVDGAQQWVLIHGFPTHEGYNHSTVIAAIRIETGYPLTALDMVYFFPALTRKDGTLIAATEAPQLLDGQVYQRWSRHRTSRNPWKIGEDNLGTHIHLIEDWLEREFTK